MRVEGEVVRCAQVNPQQVAVPPRSRARNVLLVLWEKAILFCKSNFMTSHCSAAAELHSECVRCFGRKAIVCAAEVAEVCILKTGAEIVGGNLHFVILHERMKELGEMQIHTLCAVRSGQGEGD